jgi:hypothetical protein
MNQKYGRCAIIGEKFDIIINNRKYKFIKIHCDCGIEKDVNYRSLISGFVKSCGCLRQENARRNGLKMQEKRIDWPIEDIIKDFKKGMNCSQIALKYSLDKSSVRKRLKKLKFDTSIKVGKENWKFTGYKEIYGRDWTSMQAGAKRRELEFSISKEYAWSVLEKQNKRCIFSGVELTFHKSSQDRSGTASIDRIDSKKGYIEGNIQWIHKKFQNMKRDLIDSEFIQNCCEVADFYRNNI